MSEYVIKNATLCDIKGQRELDVRVYDGVICEIGEDLSSKQEIDATHLYLLPSLIDLNIKPKSYKQQDLKKIEKKALEGGVGSIALTLPIHADESLSIFAMQSPIHFFQNINPYKEEKIQNIAKLQKNGGALIEFPSSLKTSALLCIYDYAKLLSLPCFCYANDLELSTRGSIESEMSYKMGLSSLPAYLQSIEFARISQIAHFKQVHTLLHSINDCHVLQASYHNPYTFIEVSIHHLILNETSIKNYNTWGKLNPPLCTQEMQESLVQNLALIDTLSSTHQEFSTSSKEQTFDDAISGVECLEFYFPLLYTHLVKNNIISLSELTKKTSYTQSQLLGLKRGVIEEGYDADLILVNLSESVQISHPLYGKQNLYGKIKKIFSSKKEMQNG
ncbi:amidohydrolase family protein [uncultured Helicobacter sp.]|uniref:amidohydrolase family protein n=1 Tax=uncultured Helicobacter sp. TaxID=175537 RepID=UPI0026218DD4|nr:amidohydrolase family protein [uncultured Helicobacter sp.]